MAQSVTTPRPFLEQLVGERVVVRLKWGGEYRGHLVSFDSFFNLRLANTEEFSEGTLRGDLGDVLVRCNNVLYIRDASEPATAH